MVTWLTQTGLRDSRRAPVVTEGACFNCAARRLDKARRMCLSFASTVSGCMVHGVGNTTVVLCRNEEVV
jgi:hypothetical protein